MKPEHTPRGFGIVRFEDRNKQACSLQQSSAIGDADDAWDRPGSSFVWLGVHDLRMHLSVEQAKELAAMLDSWVRTGSFGEAPDAT